MFGLSLSGSKSTGKTTQKGTIDELLTGLETVAQSQTSDKSSTGSTTNSGSTSSTGQTSSNQTGTTTGSQTGNTATTQTSNSFSDKALGLLETLFGGAGTGAEGANAGNKTRLDSATKQLAEFNLADFVAGRTNGASRDITDANNANKAGLSTNTGGSAAGNSMLALLNGKMDADAAGKIAGIQSAATAEGNSILTGLQKGVGDAAAGATGSLVGLGDLLKGGSQTTTGNQTTAMQNAQNTTNAANTTAAEQGTSQSQQLTALQESLNQLMNSLTNTTQDTLKTVDMTTKTKGTTIGATATASYGK